MDYKLLTTNVHLRKQRIILMTDYPKTECCKIGIWILSVDFAGNFEILNQHVSSKYRWKICNVEETMFMFLIF